MKHKIKISDVKNIAMSIAVIAIINSNMIKSFYLSLGNGSNWIIGIIMFLGSIIAGVVMLRAIISVIITLAANVYENKQERSK